VAGLLGALLALAAVAAESLPAAGPPALRAWVIDGSCLVYEEPDPFSSTIRIAESGDAFRVLDQSPGWYRVLLPDNRTGWIVAQRAILSSRAGARPGRVSGSKEVGFALGGALAGGCVGVVPLGAFVVYTLGGISFGEPPVSGSNAVSRTTASIALYAWATSAVIVGPAASAYGAYRAGEGDRPGGSLAVSWAAAMAGEIAGAAAGYCLGLVLAEPGSSTIFLLASAGSLAGTTAGAVIGYEYSKPAYARHYAAGRVGLPAVGFSLERDSSMQMSPAVRLDLVTVRF
jgi:hypothetical protein